jgi:hypothetical protein
MERGRRRTTAMDGGGKQPVHTAKPDSSSREAAMCSISSHCLFPNSCEISGRISERGRLSEHLEESPRRLARPLTPQSWDVSSRRVSRRKGVGGETGCPDWRRKLTSLWRIPVNPYERIMRANTTFFGAKHRIMACWLARSFPRPKSRGFAVLKRMFPLSWAARRRREARKSLAAPRSGCLTRMKFEFTRIKTAFSQLDARLKNAEQRF